MTSNTVKIHSLKRMVQRDYPENAPIRKLILSEPDEIPIEEYAIKMSVWLKLLPVKRS